MRASEDAYSTAGPLGAYIYWAKSVSTDIADVKAICPKETVKRTLTVYGGHAFAAGDFDIGTLRVYESGKIIPKKIGGDYTVNFDDGLLNISVMGSLINAKAIDIEIMELKAGRVNIYALMNDGSIPSDTIKSLILAACNQDDVRPLTDYVGVKDPESVRYNIDLTYYIADNSSKTAIEVQTAVGQAVEKYKKWQSEKLGRDINPSKLTSLLMEAGVKRIELNAPQYIPLRDGRDHLTPQIAVLGSTSVKNGGYENE